MKNLTHTALAVIVLAMNCHPVFATQPEQQTMQTQPEFKNAQDFIEFFRQGGKRYDRHKNLPNLMIGNQPDPEAMKVLGEELTHGTEDVREKIVDLLVDVARLNYPEYELRTPEVIALLIGSGFAKTDAARSNAMDVLSKFVAPATLIPYREAIAKALKEEPEDSALVLVAKAKPPQAWEEVNRLSRLPEWNEPDSISTTSLRMARAALGDTKIEDEFIADAKRKEAAGKAEDLADALHLLAQIGTPRCLQAVCGRMRTPLIIDRVGAYRKSVRLEVIDALSYAFPEEPVLDSSQIRRDLDYERVELFCTQKLGLRYSKPRPPFFTDDGYPSL